MAGPVSTLPPPPGRSPWIGLAAAALAAAGFAVRGALADVLGDHAAFLMFVPAVVVGAALGGLWPGVLGIVLGLAGGLILSGVDRPGLIDIGLFVLVGAAVTVGGEWFQRAHRSLAGREAHLRSILDTVPDAMILIDEAGRIHSFSATAERLFGWTASEVHGHNVSLLMPAAAP
jgi:two-component system sensor kinase FixL